MINDNDIGFIGLGNVGSKLAQSLAKSKYNLNVFDLDKNKSKKLSRVGAKISKNILDLLTCSKIVITCLPSPKAVKKVVENKGGFIDHMSNSHLWIEMSTTDEKEMVRLSKMIKSKTGASTLEAPVTGGQHKAKSGNISILAAGNRKNFDRALPILSEIGYKILYCGKLGNASTLKVVTNFLASINLVSLGEALMVCKKYGINLEKAYQGIKISSGNSFVHETESQVILNGSYDVGFTMDLVCKDVTFFDNLTKNLQIPSDISPLLVKIFNKGRKEYGNRSLSTSIIKLIEKKCKTNLRSKNFPSKLIDEEYKKKGFEI